VDGQGIVTSRQLQGIATLLLVRVSPDLSRYLVTKGSVTLDGVSLTITESSGPVFGVSLVTHTLQETTLGEITVETAKRRS
jgi:riboflavin synthase